MKNFRNYVHFANMLSFFDTHQAHFEILKFLEIFISCCKTACFWGTLKNSNFWNENVFFVCHMSAYNYQTRFWHFRYQSVVSNKNFGLRTCGTQNWAKNRIFCDFSWNFWLKFFENLKISKCAWCVSKNFNIFVKCT